MTFQKNWKISKHIKINKEKCQEDKMTNVYTGKH